MTTHIKILGKVDMKAFETPPVFSDEERNNYFSLPEWAEKFMKTLRTSANKIAFILQLGYFRSANKFFDYDNFHRDDINFISRILDLSEKDIPIKKHYTTHWRNRTIILKNMGFRKFDDSARERLKNEAIALSSNQITPRSLFMSLVDFLRSKKTEVPSYYALTEIITSAFKVSEKKILNLIDKYVSAEDKQLLDGLLAVDDEYLTEDKADVSIKRYRITLIKKSNHSSRPSKIKENINDLLCLKELYSRLKSTIQYLGLAPDMIQYYAGTVTKSQVFQIARRDRQKYLYLIAFVINQYYRLNDLLTDTLMQSVQTAFHAASREHKEVFYKSRHSRQETIRELSGIL